MPKENITLYAMWVTNDENIITYELNGGTNNPKNPTHYKKGEEKELYPAEKNGITFEGWYLESSYTNKIDKITKEMDGDITLYAKWPEKSTVEVPITAAFISKILVIIGALLVSISSLVIYLTTRNKKNPNL